MRRPYRSMARIAVSVPAELPLPPGPRKYFPGQHLLRLRRDVFGTLTRLAHDYGDVARIVIGPQDLVVVSHPELIRQVLITDARRFAKGRGLERTRRLLGSGLLTSEGDFHLRQRRLAQPAFSKERITAYADIMRDRAERAVSAWRDGDEIDVSHAMTRLTLEIAGATLFGADLAAETEEIGAALTEAFEIFRYSTLPYMELLDSFGFLPMNRRFAAARERLDRTIYRIIAERRARRVDREDLLSMLLNARDTEGDGSAMTDLQLRDEALTILLAGHETTANALSWTFYLLAQHPDVEARLRAELEADVGDRAVTAADASRLGYTRAVLAESMRLYPPAWTLGRKPLEDIALGGFRVRRHSLVLLSQWVVHRDERWWPDPTRFDPDRWVSDPPTARPRLAYFPFGAGTRVCIGEAFAWMEGVIVLATIAQRWRLRLVPEHPVAPLPLVTLRPRYGIRMIVGRVGGDTC
jgi:cytochrome P450